MSIPVPSVFVRHWYSSAFNNGETFDYSSLDAQHSDLVETMNLITQRLNLISTSNGTLITLASTTSFTATASQTAFTVPSYDTTNDTIHVYTNGLRLAAASITATDATTVTLPAQTVGTLVQIDIFTPGSGTTALASTSSGQGASLIGMNDAGGLFTATTVEGGMQELATNLASASYLGAVLTISNYIKKDGSVAFTGNQSMGSHKLTNLAAGTASSNDAARMADITAAALQAALGSYLSSTYLALSGGTMSGNIAMGGNKVTGLGAATSNGQAVRYEEFQAINGSQITAGTVAAARMAVMVGDSGSGGTQGVVPAPAAGDTAAQKYLRADATWQTVPSNLGAFIVLQYLVSSGTAGGASSALAWTTRPINTESVDTGNNCTLNTNQFTLLAGTYRVEFWGVMFNCNESVHRLRNVSDASTTLVGMGLYADNSDPTGVSPTIQGRFTIASTKTFEIQYWAGAAKATDGLGKAMSSGESECYASLVLIKE
jgi:hypothetical protein